MPPLYPISDPEWSPSSNALSRSNRRESVNELSLDTESCLPAPLEGRRGTIGTRYETGRVEGSGPKEVEGPEGQGLGWWGGESEEPEVVSEIGGVGGGRAVLIGGEMGQEEAVGEGARQEVLRLLHVAQSDVAAVERRGGRADR